jgi:hypothetical protein
VSYADAPTRPATAFQFAGCVTVADTLRTTVDSKNPPVDAVTYKYAVISNGTSTDVASSTAALFVGPLAQVPDLCDQNWNAVCVTIVGGTFAAVRHDDEVLVLIVENVCLIQRNVIRHRIRIRPWGRKSSLKAHRNPIPLITQRARVLAPPPKTLPSAANPASIVLAGRRITAETDSLRSRQRTGIS